MKYYSDLTKKFYEKASECEKAEAAFKAEQKKKEEEALQKSTARKEAAKKVEEAYNKLIAAKKEYESILSDFCKEYGTYHTSINEDSISDWLDAFWGGLFF